MKTINLKCGAKALVDDLDYLRLKKYSWHLGSLGYVKRSERTAEGKQTTIRMARQIMNPAKDMEVDHINHNVLDNRRRNLRIVTKQQNIWNSGPRSVNTTVIKGVGWHKLVKKYQARIPHGGKTMHIGYFDDPLEAKSAYQSKAIELRGEFAYRQ